MDIKQSLAKRTPFFYGWVIVAAAGSTNFVRNSAATLTIAVFVFPMNEDLGWSRSLIVGAAAAGGIAAMFASPIAGWLLQRFGPRALLTGSVLALGLSILSIRWVGAPAAFYLAYGVGRVIFASPVQIGAATVVAQWFIRRRGRATAILGLAHSLGMGFFPLFAQLLINANGGDWRMAWFWLGLTVWIVALPPVFFLMIGRPEEVGLRPDGDIAETDAANSASRIPEGPQWTLQEAMRTPAMWMLAVVGGLTFFIHTGVNIHQAAFLRDQGISATVAASALMVMAVGTGVGSLVWGNLLDRVSTTLVYVGVCAWLGTVALLFLLVDSAPVAFVVAALFGVGLGGLLVVPPVVLANYFGRRSLGAIRGATEPFVSGGQAIGAVGAGLIYDTTGSYTATFPVFTAAAVIGIVLVFLARAPAHPRPAVAADAPTA
ncbi:MAG: MFS transporter [Dehalococcoidia bacterium]